MNFSNFLDVLLEADAPKKDYKALRDKNSKPREINSEKDVDNYVKDQKKDNNYDPGIDKKKDFTDKDNDGDLEKKEPTPKEEPIKEEPNDEKTNDMATEGPDNKPMEVDPEVPTDNKEEINNFDANVDDMSSEETPFDDTNNDAQTQQNGNIPEAPPAEANTIETGDTTQSATNDMQLPDDASGGDMGDPNGGASNFDGAMNMGDDGSNPEAGQADGMGGDPNADPGMGDENLDGQQVSNEESHKMYNVLTDFKLLYELLENLIDKLNSTPKSDLVKAQLIDECGKQLQSLKDAVYSYILIDFSKNTYKYNLYMYNYFITLVKVAVEMLENINYEKETKTNK